MNEEDRKERNEERLGQLYPTFRTRVEQVIQTLQASGLRPRIQDARRSPEAQQQAFDTGHSKLRYGFHNVTGKDGTPESLAVDLLDDDNPLNPGAGYLLQLAAAAESAGLITGIRWGLPAKLSSAIDTAIASQNWGANVKMGWDPTHVQPTDITVAAAKAGKRPA